MSDCRPTSLLHKVQMARIFADSKTFVDMSIKRDDHAPNDVLGSFDDLMAKVGRGVEDAVQLLPSSRCIGPGNNVPSVRTGSVKFQLPGRVLPRVSRILLWLTIVPWKKYCFPLRRLEVTPTGRPWRGSWKITSLWRISWRNSSPETGPKSPPSSKSLKVCL